MNIRVQLSHPQEAIPAQKKFVDHHFHRDDYLAYLGTHYGVDVYVNKQTGDMYCVYGNEPQDYESAVGFQLTRSNTTNSPTSFALAAAIALLHHPEYIEKVLKAHGN